MVLDQYKEPQPVTFATVFIGVVFFILGAALFFDGLSAKYPNTTESYFGAMVLFLVIISGVSIAFSRLDTATYNRGPALDFSKLPKGFLNMLAGMFAILIEFKYLVGQTNPTMIIGILWWVVLLIVILSIVCFVGIKNDPDAKKKEKKQKGYIKHLNGLIMGIGSVYGFMLILYYFHIVYGIPTSSNA